MFFDLCFIWIEEPGYRCPQDYDKHVDTKMPLAYGDNTVEGFTYITDEAELKSRLVWKYRYENGTEASWLESWRDEPPADPAKEYGTFFGIMVPDITRWVIHEDCYQDIIFQILDDAPEDPEDPHPDNNRPKFKALGIGPRKKSSYLMHYTDDGWVFLQPGNVGIMSKINRNMKKGGTKTILRFLTKFSEKTITKQITLHLKIS